jgi:hypothetical protein
MANVTTQLIFVFLKKEIPNVVYRGNTAFLHAIVTLVSAFSASRLASWREYLVRLNSRPAETYAYSTYIDINNYVYETSLFFRNYILVFPFLFHISDGIISTKDKANSLRSLSYDRSIASSSASSPQRAG